MNKYRIHVVPFITITNKQKVTYGVEIFRESEWEELDKFASENDAKEYIEKLYAKDKLEAELPKDYYIDWPPDDRRPD